MQASRNSSFASGLTRGETTCWGNESLTIAFFGERWPHSNRKFISERTGPSSPLPEMACFEQAGDKYQEFSVDIEVFRLVRHRDFQSFYSVICELNGI